MDHLFNIVGIAGIALIIIAYFLLEIGKLTINHWAYPLLNFIGALLHLISLYRFWNLASCVIEIFWIAISCYGFFKIFKNTSAHRS